MGLGRRRFLGAAAALGTAAACGRDVRTPEPPHRPEETTGAATPRTKAEVPHRPGEIVHGSRRRRQVALTFHGSGDPAVARRVLAAAADGGARITVLAVGVWLDSRPEMAKLILDGGHELGNHTQHHADINAMDEAAAYAEIAECAARLRRLTGGIGTWFRPSQTPHANALVRAQAARAGYRSCLSYDVDSLDFTDPGPRAVVRNVLRGARGGSIVSMHLGHPGTAEALPAVLDGLRRKGLHAVTVSTLLRP